MNTVNIVLISDNNYVMPTFVTINSIVKNKKRDTVLNVHILAVDIYEDLANVFKSITVDNVNIDVISVSAEKYKNLHRQKSNSYCVASVSALLKFDIPNIFEKLDKILYLDSDLIIKGDLSALFNTDIEYNYVAAVQDSGCLYSKQQYIAMVESYFNSGVMLLNLKKMRENDITNVLIEEKMRQTDFSLMDQNVLNVVFDGNVKLLPIKYNLLYVNLVRAKAKYTMKNLNKMFSSKYKNLEDIVDDAVIVHYSSKDKPWKNKSAPMRDLWLEYYVQTKEEYDIIEKITRAKLHNKKVIVSVTSYPARIADVNITLQSILDQTFAPDKIILWLLKSEFPNLEKDLPAQLLELVGEKIEIGWFDENLRPHNKYYYVMSKYPEDLIITVDDDVIYENTIIEDLIKCYLKHPFAVSALRVHLMAGDNKNLKSYNDWKKRYNGCIDTPSMQLIATGVGGVLYPPHCMSPKVFDREIIKKTCLRADDLWLKFMQVQVGTPVVLATKHNGLTYIDGSQECALWNTNECENDIQFANIMNELDEKSPNGESLFLSRCFDIGYYDNGNTGTGNWNKLNREIRNIKKSRSYRIGRAITKFPRLIRSGFRCLKDHGFKYTWCYFWEKVANKFKK